MMLEGEGKAEEALQLFEQAWALAANTTEKFTAAHYVARRQETIAGKLTWDETALNLALEIDTEEIKAVYPSLYLNVAKCYEDLEDYPKAHDNYLMALNFAPFLPADGYGDMIKAGINNGINRVKGNDLTKVFLNFPFRVLGGSRLTHHHNNYGYNAPKQHLPGA
ncbi:rRNA adenine methyltransferase [Mucilaginibacter sp. AK015]|uniref:rRNA adenine methyltransferase n=1 Tax=Mucilaginibacter sp. AK015 TaxID=2723072 RepID=UPI00160FE7CA|nr:rRNA adenine methyltransferase [Mucilaginibacter sp. AK015]MBB5395371.1 rifampin ADP-ribosylating transferase [Mucilaginibacter sp. AK015]